jgi:hypothetical protein
MAKPAQPAPTPYFISLTEEGTANTLYVDVASISYFHADSAATGTEIHLFGGISLLVSQSPADVLDLIEASGPGNDD